MKDQSFFQKCCHCFGKEFKRDNFKLNHVPVDDFYISQWQKDTKSVYFLIYRWLLALFFIGVVFTCMVFQWSGGKFFIFLTDWGFLLCMITCVYGAVLVSINYCRPFDSVKQTWTFKIYWALHITTLILAVIITIVYWIFLWPKDTHAKSSTRSLAFNAFQHACNTGVMFFDQFVVAFPTRLLHVIYPLGLGVIYAVFSAIYYGAGGTDPNGNHYIYDILDWSNPGGTFLTILGVFVLCAIVMVIMYGSYKLRRLIYESFHNVEFDLPY
ncbi:hypothetical protein ACFFRR_009142 [Megaselia abdita]